MRTRTLGLLLPLGSVVLLLSAIGEGIEGDTKNRETTDVSSCADGQAEVTEHFSLCIEGDRDVAKLGAQIESFYYALSRYLGFEPDGTMAVIARLSRDEVLRELYELGFEPSSTEGSMHRGSGTILVQRRPRCRACRFTL